MEKISTGQITKHLPQNKNDVSSLSNFLEIRQKQFQVELYINFNNKTLEGYTVIKFQVLSHSNTLVLDTKGLVIHQVLLVNTNNKDSFTISEKSTELKFVVHTDHPSAESLGTPLEIFLPFDNQTTPQYFDIKITYSTTKASAGLQWLDKEQTHSKTYPYVFSQCEAILARSCLPCQDSPGAKALFSKVVLVTDPDINALFGGKRLSHHSAKASELECIKNHPNRSIQVSKDNKDNKTETKEETKEEQKFSCFEYTQPTVIPTYLFSIAAGEIVYEPISERCGIYTEPHLLEKAVSEFKDIEIYLKAAEEYFDYPYIWGDYNILFLPQAFPYGGMENPNLTFLNNALLVGDKSMVGTIAHEIAHSWTGNLVTNKDWDNFWVNEGFTVFMERKLMELVQSKELATLEADVGYDEFVYAVNAQGPHHRYTQLLTELKDEDPDDAFSVVPYEKGFNLLFYIEKLLGEELFRDILRKYIKTYAYCSVSYVEFKQLLEKEVAAAGKEELLTKVDWNTWLRKPGFLPVNVDFKTKLADNARLLFEGIVRGKYGVADVATTKEIFTGFAPFVKVVFLNLFINNLEKLKSSKSGYEVLSKTTLLNSEESNNPEIMYTWLQVALRMHDAEALEPTKRFLLKQGRMKYIRPVFIVFYKFKKDECKEFFEKNKGLWHVVPTRLIDNEFKKIDSSI